MENMKGFKKNQYKSAFLKDVNKIKLKNAFSKSFQDALLSNTHTLNQKNLKQTNNSKKVKFSFFKWPQDRTYFLKPLIENTKNFSNESFFKEMVDKLAISLRAYDQKIFILNAVSVYAEGIKFCVSKVIPIVDKVNLRDKSI